MTSGVSFESGKHAQGLGSRISPLASRILQQPKHSYVETYNRASNIHAARAATPSRLCLTSLALFRVTARPPSVALHNRVFSAPQ